MLLEQHKEAVLNLLSDPKLLEEQVKFALKTLKEYVTYYISFSFSKCIYIPNRESTLQATCNSNLQNKR